MKEREGTSNSFFPHTVRLPKAITESCDRGKQGQGGLCGVPAARARATAPGCSTRQTCRRRGREDTSRVCVCVRLRGLCSPRRTCDKLSIFTTHMHGRPARITMLVQINYTAGYAAATPPGAPLPTRTCTLVMQKTIVGRFALGPKNVHQPWPLALSCICVASSNGGQRSQ